MIQSMNHENWYFVEFLVSVFGANLESVSADSVSFESAADQFEW